MPNTPIDIGIPEDQRQALADGLARLLADNASLYFKTHSFHWNVTGPMFQTLHVMFEQHYNEMWLAMDEIAERMRSLGSYAAVSWADIASNASIPEATEVPAAQDMIRQLVAGHETLIRTARALLPQTGEAGDEVTADLITQRLQVHEKTAWMLRSLLA
jgi:starvation-inducible DNA-binding protein